jgi:hypothetical protein
MTTLAAPHIVYRNTFLVNRMSCEIGIGPLIEFHSIKCDSLFSYRNFPYVRAYGFIED